MKNEKRNIDPLNINRNKKSIQSFTKKEQISVTF